MNLKLSLRMPCCGNILTHADDCSDWEKEKYAEEGYIV